jgi:hypothetical protein
MDAGVPVTPVGLAAAEDPATPRELVTLGPYGTASALLRIVPIYVGYTAQTCAKPVQILTVDAMRPGSGSS